MTKQICIATENEVIGEEEWQTALRAQKARQDADHAAGIPALKRLYEVARRDSGQPRHIAAFLLGLYNGRRFPFDLTDLRCIDTELFEDCMLVLRMDRCPRQEVHCYFDNGGVRFEDLARFHGIKNASDRYSKN